MTQSPETRKFDSSKQRSKSSKVWIVLSFTLSALILGWAFSLPFYHSGSSLVSFANTDTQSEAFRKSEQIVHRRSQAEDFRQTAIELNERFMRSIRNKRESEKRSRPGLDESRERWQQHVSVVKKQLLSVRYAKEGTVEWDYQQSLLESLEDGPR